MTEGIKSITLQIYINGTENWFKQKKNKGYKHCYKTPHGYVYINEMQISQDATIWEIYAVVKKTHGRSKERIGIFFKRSNDPIVDFQNALEQSKTKSFREKILEAKKTLLEYVFSLKPRHHTISWRITEDTILNMNKNHRINLNLTALLATIERYPANPTINAVIKETLGDGIVINPNSGMFSPPGLEMVIDIGTSAHQTMKAMETVDDISLQITV